MLEPNIPIGSNVKMIKCHEAEMHPDTVWTTRCEPWRIASGEWLVLLEGRSGGFDCDCLQMVEPIKETAEL